jgi:probable rRNA maturation factor
MSAPSLSIDVTQESPLWQARPETEALVGQAATATLAVARLACRAGAELSVVLTDDAGIAVLNRSWRGKEGPTNVLSFPAAPPGRVALSPMLGDIVFAYETIEREAEALRLPFGAHLTHLVVHGVLHLFGHDHQTDEEAAAMEGLETAVLSTLGVDDPYASPPPRAASRDDHVRSHQ